jgi:hypothetical protein
MSLSRSIETLGRHRRDTIHPFGGGLQYVPYRRDGHLPACFCIGAYNDQGSAHSLRDNTGRPLLRSRTRSVLQTIQNRGVAELGLRWPKTNKKAQHQYQLPIKHSGCMSTTRRRVLATEALELTILSGDLANHHVLPDCAFGQRPPGSSRAQ